VRIGPSGLHSRLPFALRNIKRLKLIAGVSQRLASRLSRLEIQQRRHDRRQWRDQHIAETKKYVNKSETAIVRNHTAAKIIVAAATIAADR